MNAKKNVMEKINRFVETKRTKEQITKIVKSMLLTHLKLVREYETLSDDYLSKMYMENLIDRLEEITE